MAAIRRTKEKAGQGVDGLNQRFVEELREYQVILDSPDPDIVRLSEILNDLIEYVLDTDSAYVMFRVILKVFHERQRKEKQKKEGAKKGHSPQNRGAYLEEFSSSDSKLAKALAIADWPRPGPSLR